jgi:hypothetical protein
MGGDLSRKLSLGGGYRLSGALVFVNRSSYNILIVQVFAVLHLLLGD